MTSQVCPMEVLISVFACVCALQLVRECKEVLKGGLLMKQYYQFMLRGVVTDSQGLQTNANIDEFEEDLHKMLVVKHLTLLPMNDLPVVMHY